MMKEIEIVISYLEEQEEAARESCGEDDEINYLPAHIALIAARKIKLKYINYTGGANDLENNQNSYAPS